MPKLPLDFEYIYESLLVPSARIITHYSQFKFKNTILCPQP